MRERVRRKRECSRERVTGREKKIKRMRERERIVVKNVIAKKESLSKSGADGYTKQVFHAYSYKCARLFLLQEKGSSSKFPPSNSPISNCDFERRKKERKRYVECNMYVCV